MKRLFKKLGKKTISHQKTALTADFGNNSGSEFPDVTEQISLVSEVLGRAESANLSRSIKKALITEGSFGSVENSFIEETLSTRISNIIPQMHELRRQTATRAFSLSQMLTPTVNGFIRLTKKTLVMMLLALVIFTSSGLYLLFFLPKQASAAWFNEGWAYRTPLTITHNASVSNQKVKFDIDTATLITNGKIQSDCGDSRFTDINGKLLRYYLDSSGGACNTASTDYYVLIPTINNGTTVIYHYYGSPTASNGTEVANFSEATLTPSTGISAGSEAQGPGPVGYWKFDDGQGTTAQDSTSSNLDGTLNNTPTWQTENMCIAGKCLYFDGTNNENVSKSDDAMLDFAAADSFTLSAWVKRNGASSANNFIITKAQAGYTGYKLYQDASGDYCFDVSDGTNTDTACTSAVEFDDDKWHLVQGVKSGTASITLYVDGNQRAQDTSIAATGTLANTGTFYIGVDLDGTSNEWLGFIDDVKVYNFARTAVQILQDYASGLANAGTKQGTSAVLGASTEKWLSDGLVGYWKMDESSGNAADSSGNGTTLTNNNITTFAAGKFGNGSSYNGTSQYFSAASTISSVQSIAFWVYPASTTDNYINLNGSTYITSSSGTVSGTGITSPSIYVNGTLNGAITASAWNHVVITTATAVSASTFEIGRANGSYLSNTGKTDEIRIYNRALSSKEVSDLYNWAPGPAGYWNFEERTGATAYDISGNANNGSLGNGTAVNYPAWTTGKVGSALKFDGSNDFVWVTDNAALDPSVGMSLSAWVKLNALPSSGTKDYIMIDKWSGAGNQRSYEWDVLQSDNKVYFFASAAGTVTDVNIASNNALTVNTWYHLEVAYDGTTVRMYVNGVQQTATATVSSIYASTTNFVIGGNDSGSTTNPFNGWIDDVKIYNYGRTAKQVVSDMNAGHPAVGSPVGSSVGYWKFDEGYGTTANDSTPNAKNLTLSSASWTDSGKFGKAWNGTGALWLSRADDNDLDFVATDDFSISLWFKSDSATNPGAIEYLFNKASATVAGYAIYANTSGNICFGIDDDTTWTPDDSACTSTDIYDATWHHIVATKTGTNRIDIYVDGVSKGSDTSIAATGTLTNSLSLYVGDRDGVDNGDEFNGDLDEIKVYRYALTADEVKLDYNRSSSLVLGALSDNSSYQVNAANQEYCIPGDTSACTTPIGRWDFEEGTGTTVYDKSGSAYNGTITGATYQSGKSGKVLNFNGSTDAVDTISSISSIKTVSFWVNPSTTTQNLIDLQTSPSTINISVSGGTVSATGFTSPTIYVNGVSGGTVTANAWNHVEITTGTAFAGSAVRFGRISTTSLTGKLDAIRFFDYARSAAQVAWDYNRGKPVGWWKFDECQGATTYDSSGNSNSGTITIGTGAGTGHQDSVGTCTASEATAWYNGVSGKRNYSLNFDGIDDYIDLSDPSNGVLDFGTGDFSISAWIKTSSTGVNQDIFDKRSSDGTTGYLLGVNSSNGITAWIGDGVHTAVSTTSSSTVTNGNWHHIVTTYSRGGNSTIYIDGTQNGTPQSISGVSSTISNSGNANIAYRYPGASVWSYFNGQIDDVRIYNYALTPTQLKEAMNDGAVRFGPATGSP